jgi:hypothetical protein
MAKTKPATSPTTASSTDASAPLSIAAITTMAPAERVNLYVSTERRVNASFLLQGKILSTLDKAESLLKAAGIKPTSLGNARCAEWVLSTLPALDKPVLFAVQANREGDLTTVPFTEGFYDQLTLRQCEILRKSLTLMGTVKHRPTVTESRAICAGHADWDDQLESFLDTGLTLAGLAAREVAQAQEAATERQRIIDMESSMVAMQAQIAAQAAHAAANPPPPPPVVTAPVVVAAVAPVVTVATVTATDAAPDEADQEDEVETVEETPANIVAFTAPAAEDEQEQEQEQPAEIEDDAEDHLTPEEVGAAVADAMDGVPSTDIITQSIAGLQDDLVDCIEIADLSELRQWEMELQQILNLVRTHIAAKAEPQDELPATPAKKAKKAKLAA